MHELRAPSPLVRAVLLLLATVLLAVGCGDDETDDAPTDAADETTATTQALQVPAVTESRTIELPGTEVFPEGITFDPEGERIYVSSTTDGTIFTGTPDAEALTALPRPADGPQSSIGLATGPDGALWVAGGAAGTGWLLDRETGAVRGRHLAPGSGATFVNDVTVDEDGTAYFTDSNRPTIYAATADMEPGAPLEAFADLSDGPIPFDAEFNLNGIVVTGDQRYLLVVHSGNGRLYRIPLGGGEAAEVDLGDARLDGGDGLALVEQTLYVVQGDEALVAIVDLDAAWASGTVRGTLTDPSFGRPTTIAVQGDELFVVNSQFDQREGTPELPFTVSALLVGADPG